MDSCSCAPTNVCIASVNRKPRRDQSRKTAMWVRQSELDAGADVLPPIPARIASNEEFVPPPQSPRQREYLARLVAIGERAAQHHGICRREFFRSSSGMAAALVAMNQVFGDCYQVSAEEVD